MKKIILTICLVIGMSSLVYADFFCCGAGENTWCCPSDNECGTNTGECCNPSKTTCCSGDKPYAFRKKTWSCDFSSCSAGSRETHWRECKKSDPCTISETDTYECCLCPDDLVYNTKTGQCELCFDGVKGSCTTCIECAGYKLDFDEFYDYDLYAGMCVSFRPDQNYWPNNETSVQRPLCSDRTVLVIIDKDSLWDLCSDDECCRYMHTDLICCPPENKELFVGKASDRANCDNGIKYFWTCEGAVYPEEL